MPNYFNYLRVIDAKELEGEGGGLAAEDGDGARGGGAVALGCNSTDILGMSPNLPLLYLEF